MAPAQSRPLRPAKSGETSKSSTQRKPAPSGRISAACEACKKRKTKCTGGPPPCQLCESLGTECIIDLTLDMRRRAALQRTIDESKAFQETLAGLLVCLRDGDPNIIGALTDLLRTGALPDDIASAVQQHTQTVLNKTSEERLEDKPAWLPESLLTNPSQNDTAGSAGTAVDEQTESIVSVASSSPSTEAKGKAEIDPTVLDEQSELATSVVLSSSPSKKAKGRTTSGLTYHMALLHRLRTVQIADGEIILRSLVDTENLAQVFEQDHIGSDSKLTSPHSPYSSHSSHGLASPAHDSNLNEPRRNWHPALALLSQTQWAGQVPAQDHKISTIAGSENLEASVSEPAHTEHHPKSDDVDMSGVDSVASASPTSKHLPTHAVIVDDGTYPALSFNMDTWRMPYTLAAYNIFDGRAEDLCVARDDGEYRIKIPLHLVQPLNVPDEASMSRVHTDYLQAARQMLINGTPTTDILNSDDDVVVDLLYRARTPADEYDCSSWACEVFRTFTEFDLYVRLANIFFSTRLMKWLLVPTPENYAKLPEMMRPTPTQNQVPHIGAIDHIPIPCIRDAVIADLRDWLVPLGKAGWRVNWTKSESAAVVRDDTTGSMKLSMMFMEHVQKPENWTMGITFLRSFPELAGRVNLHS